MDTFEALNALARDIYKNAVDHGFYDTELQMTDVVGENLNRSIILQQLFFGQRIALIHSELSEALEADRINRYAKNLKLVESMLGPSDVFLEAFRKNIKDSIEDEIADALIRILDLCASRGIDIGRHVRLKMAYNKNRPKLHGKEY